MTEAQVSEAIIALASAVSGKDLTSEGDGTKATALTVLSDALGDPETDADTALYDAAQFATRRSTDTEEAAKSVLALSSGGGAQSYPITVDEGSQGNFGFYVHDATGQWTVPVTELEGGVPFVIKEEDGKALTGDNLSLEADYTIPVMYGFDSMQNQAFAIMPNSELHVYLYIE